MQRTALFAGSFDPITNGHLDVVGKAVHLADRLVLAIGSIPARRRCSRPTSGSPCARNCVPLARAAGCEVTCTTFADLVVTAARRAGATLLVRGVRDATDFDYEMQMAGMNAAMAPEVQTRIPAGFARGPPDHRHVGPANCRHGRRCLGLRAGAGCGAAQKEIRQKLNPSGR